MEELRYPIGRFRPSEDVSADERERLIDDIAGLPADVRGAVADLSPAQLDTPYRPGGWTVRQVVHHLPDSHLNSSLRPNRFERAFRHPEMGAVTLDTSLQLYAWHGRHHLAHIERLREREGW